MPAAVAHLDRVDATGAGRGTLEDGSPVRVPGALPGERVQVGIEHVQKDGLVHARLIQVEVPSAARVDPICPHFLRCGGCDLLHASPVAQLELKRSWVARALGVGIERVDPVIESPRAFGYRALAKLVVGPGRVLGSYKPRSHDVVDMSGCRVHAPEAEAIVDALRYLVQAPAALDLRYILVRASLAEGRAVVTLVSRTEAAPGVREVAERLKERPDVAAIVLIVNASEGDALLGDGPSLVLYEAADPIEIVGRVTQSLRAGAFAQINPLAAAALYRVASSSIPSGGRVLDLYSGSGGLALSCLVAGAREVTAVEWAEAGCRAARASAEAMGLGDRLHTVQARVEDALAEIDATFEAVILNPPRKGAGESVCAALVKRPWKRLVYVSCNPDSLARDVEILGASAELVRVTPVDLFPQTRHVETVLVLQRF